MGGGGEGRSLEVTPTWAVAAVCVVLVSVLICIEYTINLLAKWLKSTDRRALYEALEKITSELMLLGFISLLLTALDAPLSRICVPESVGATWHPCSRKQEQKLGGSSSSEHRRGLLAQGRVLAAGGGGDNCALKGKVPLVSGEGIHQLHMFIFVLALSHVVYCITTLALGRAKMRRWKAWEKETTTAEYQLDHDPDRFRFARETTFGRRHLSFWTKSPILLWTVCFFRQFVRSVPKVDYFTLRHGFIMAHLPPQSNTKFDFHKYIKRSLEEDFKVVVGIRPLIWLFAIFFLLFNTHGWYSYLWLPFIPLIAILLVGTKLQVIITKMGLRIQGKGEVVKGPPLVEPGDDLFWFNRPHLVLFVINFVLFQNAFQLAFVAWIWYEFGLSLCFHENIEDLIIRISMGVLIQILCSYVTLPLYALVTQMGSNMKPIIFNERIATGLRKWHLRAKKHIKDQSKHNNGGSMSPISTSQGASPFHLLRGYNMSSMDNAQSTPQYDFELALIN